MTGYKSVDPLNNLDGTSSTGHSWFPMFLLIIHMIATDTLKKLVLREWFVPWGSPRLIRVPKTTRSTVYVSYSPFRCRNLSLSVLRLRTWTKNCRSLKRLHELERFRVKRVEILLLLLKSILLTIPTYPSTYVSLFLLRMVYRACKLSTSKKDRVSKTHIN